MDRPWLPYPGPELSVRSGIGSFTEALLLDGLAHRDPTLQQGFPQDNGKRVAPERAGFALLLDPARIRGRIQMDAHDFMAIVREYRNFVHLHTTRTRRSTRPLHRRHVLGTRTRRSQRP